MTRRGTIGFFGDRHSGLQRNEEEGSSWMAATLVSVTQYAKHRRTEECVCFEARVLPFIGGTGGTVPFKATGVLGMNRHGMESGGDTKNEV
jgi:hypothetical protein